jgi:alpha-1,3-rhamnosyl/mannosyltransferase
MGMVTMMMPGDECQCHKLGVYQMRVVIDASPLLVRSAGVKNYLYHWILALRRAAGAGGDDIRTLPATAHLGALTHEASVAGRWRTLTGLARVAAANYTPLPVMDFATRGADVFHASVLVRRPPSGPRLTATLHDLTAFLLPELHPPQNRRAEEAFAQIARKADGLIAVSQCTKNDAVRVLGIAAEKIEVIHSGVADAFFDAPQQRLAEVRARYGLSRPFVLYVGTIEPRKNIEALLDAFQALPPAIRTAHDLVIAGPLGWAPDETVERIRRSRYLGYVPEADLAPLTAAATVFAYPSLYEGFGFPVAQAMAAGVAVVTSNVSSLPEVAGDAALLVDPRDRGALAGALERLLEDTALRANLAAAGRARAQGFRWDVCAAKSMAFFRRVTGGRLVN